MKKHTLFSCVLDGLNTLSPPKTGEFSHSKTSFSRGLQRFALLLIFSVAMINAYAVTITVSSTTESRCLSNGTITVAGSAGTAPYQYRILSGPGYPTPGVYQSSATFINLAPGTYSVEVKDATTATNNVSATVAGSYTIPTFVVDSVRDESCPCTGAIFTRVSAGGRGPFIYRMRTTGTATWGANQSSSTFNNVCTGNYDVQVEDSCGNIQTVNNVFVGVKGGAFRFEVYDESNYNSTKVYPWVQRQNCGTGVIGFALSYYGVGLTCSQHYTQVPNASRTGLKVISDYSDTSVNMLNVIGGTPPYVYTLTGTNGYTATQTGSSKFKDVPMNGVYTIQVTDACGRSFKAAITADPLPLNKHRNFMSSNCINNSYAIYSAANCAGGYYYSIYRQDTNSYRDWIRPTGNTTYTLYNGPEYGVLKPYRANSTPGDSLYMWQYNGTYPITYQVVSGPGAPYPPVVRTAEGLGQPGQYTPLVLNNVDPTATYVVKVTDACGQVIYDTVKNTSNDTLRNITLVWDGDQACPGYMAKRFDVGAEQAMVTSVTSVPAGGVATFGNLTTPLLGARVSAGVSYYFKKGYTYTIEWTGVCTGVKLTRTYNFTAFDTVTITTKEDPPCVAGTSTGSIYAKFDAVNFALTNIPLLFSGDYNPNWTYNDRIQVGSVIYTGGSYTFTNLPAGKYTIMLRSYSTTDVMHCLPYKTVVLDAYQALKSEVEAAPICSPATTAQIAAVNTALGKPTYKYQIKLSSDPPASYSPIQYSPIFVKPAGTYDIRVLDSCSNSVTVSGTLGTFSPPSLTSNLTTCANSSIVITANKIRNMRYKWYKQGVLDATQTTNVYTYPNATLADAGVYRCVIKDTVGTCDTSFTDITISIVNDPNPATINLPSVLCSDDTLTLIGGSTNTPAPTAGNWTFVSGPMGANPTIAAVTSPTTTAFPTPANKLTPYIFRWTYNNGTCSSNKTDTVKILPLPTILPGSNILSCEATSETLTEKTLGSGYTGRWSQVSGPTVTITDKTNPQSTVTGLTFPNTYKFRWTVYNIEDTTSCSTIHDITLTNSQKPSLAQAGPDTLLCGGSDVYAMKGVAPTAGTGRWTILSWPSSTSAPSININSATSNVTLPAAGTYVFEWQTFTTGSCPASRDTVVINRVVAKAGPDVYVCTTPAVAAKMKAVKLTPGFTGTWSVAANSPKPGPLTFIPNVNSDTAQVLGYSAGKYYLVWTVSSGACTATDTAILTANVQPTKPLAGADQLGLCANSTILSGTLGHPRDSSAYKYWSKLSGPAVSFSKYDSLTNTIGLFAEGTYNVQLEIIQPGCISVYDTMVITKTGTPPNVKVDSFKNPTCVGLSNGIIYVSSTPTINQTHEYRVNGGTWQSSKIFTGLAAGTYTVDVRNALAINCVNTAPVPVTLTPTNSSPTANAGRDTTLCAGKIVQLGAASVSGNTYLWAAALGLSSTTISNPTFSSTTSNVYTRTLEVTTTATGCKGYDTVVITVNPLPVVSITSSNAAMCQGQTRTLSGIPAGGTFIGTGVVGTTFTAPTTAGSYTIKYAVTNATGCSDTATQVIVVNPKVTLGAITFSPTAVCVGSTTTASSSPTGGTWSIVSGPATINASSGVLTATGSILVTVRYVHPGVSGTSCPDTVSATITPTAVPVATVTSSTAAMCVNSTRALTGTPAGGTFTVVSGGGSIAGTTLTATSAGTISLKYSVTSSGCSDDTIVNITVNALPTVSITSSSASMCPGGTRTLAGSPAGGTFSGTGVSGTTFTAPATAGNYTITYSYTDANTCSNTATQTITVNPLVTLGAITFSPATVCSAGGTTTASGSPAGGTWSLVSGSGTVNSSSGVITASGTTAIVVRYSHPGVAGTSCPTTIDGTITPTASPVATVTSSTAAMCVNSTRALTGTPAGGTFTVVSGGGSIAGTTLTATSAGTISLKYSVTSSGCSDDTIVYITVNSLPTVSITSSSASMCPGGTRTLAGSPAGGTFSGTGVSGTTFTAPATAGNYTITYIYTDANTCSNTATQTITVNPLVTLGAITFSPATVCSAGGTTTASGSPAGGTWSLVSGSGTVNSSSGVVTASGTTAIVVRYSHPGVAGTSCPSTIDGTITPTASPVATVTSSTAAMCVNSTRALTGTPAGGTFTVVSGGGSIAGTTLTATSAGTISLKYSVTSSGCSDDTIVNITVNALPTVAITSSNANICQGQTRTLVGSPAGGTFSGTGVSGTTFTAPATTGNYTITYSYTDANTCSNTTTQSIAVNPSPVVNAGANDTICFGTSKVLTGTQTTSLTGLTYEWYKQGSTTPIPPTGTTVTVSPTATSNYVFIATTGAGCSSSDTMNLGVINKPDLVNDMTTCQSATEDVTATIPLANLTTNDNNSAVIKGGITYTVLTPKHGTASISGTNITYLANTNYNGADTVQLVGASTLCPSLNDTAIFCINIAAVNDTPIAMNDTATTPMGTAVTKNLLTNDSDVDNTLTGTSITIISGPTNGSLGTVDAAGNVTYTPNANFVGIDTVMYKVCDAGTPVLCDTAYAYFNVTPNIADTTTTTAGNTTSPIVVGPSLGTVSTATVSGPTHNSGTATVDPMTGAVTFTPSSTPFIGKDTVVRIVGVMTTNGMVYDTSLIVINNPPVNDTLRGTTTMNTPLGFPKPSPIVFEGTPIAPVLSPTLTLNADGTVTYTPKPGFVGIDTARLVRCDDKGNCHTTVYIVTVTPNYADTAVMTPQGTPISVASPVTLYPGQSLNTTVLNPTDNGTTTINPDGSITYTPNPSFVGRDTIVRQICVYDTATMLSFCDTVTTIFVVTPKVADTSAITFVGTPVTSGAPVNKLPGQSVTISTAGPSNGTATVNPDGTVTYTPVAGFVGKDTVKRIVCTYDSVVMKTTCDTSLIVFTVLPKPSDVNTSTTTGSPVTSGSPVTTYPGTSTTVSTSGPNNGTVTVNPNGTITYTPSAGFVGRDTVKRIVCVYDSMSKVTLCDTSLIIITTVPPTIIHYDTTDMNKPVMLVGFSNPDFLGTKPIVTITSSAGSTVSIGTDGKPNYTPKPDFIGVDTIRITRCDSLGNCATDIYIVTVSASNFDIPNYFSPNGDGVDDNFVLPAALYAKYPNLKLTIYNRWGNIVWRSTGKYTNDWHAQSLGSELPVPDGVYYYLIELNSEFKETKTGFIEVMRQ